MDPKGQGFYHITTREAYAILEREISRKKQQVASDIAMAQGCCGSKKDRALIPGKERELSRLDLMRKIVAARAESNNRHGAVILSGATESELSTICKEFYSPEGDWYFPKDLCKYGSAYRAPLPPPSQSRGRTYYSSSPVYGYNDPFYNGGIGPVGAGIVGGGIGFGTGLAIGMATNCGGGACNGFGFGGGACNGFNGMAGCGAACGGMAGCGGGVCGGMAGCGGGMCGGGL